MMLFSDFKTKWNDYNIKCTEGIEEENLKSEIFRMNNNFLFTIIAVLPFMCIDLYFGVIPLIWNKCVTLILNVIFIYLSSTKKFKFASHYLMSGVLMSTLFHADNYLGPSAHLYLFYYSALIEFALSYLNKRLSVVLWNVGATLLYMFVAFYFDHKLFLTDTVSDSYLTIIKWSSFITFFYSIIFHIQNSMIVRRRYEQLLEYEQLEIKKKQERMTEERIVLEMQKQDAEYRLLKNQLNPHFVYNTLETIKYLYKNNTQKCDEFIMHLSDFLRISLKNDSGVVEIEKELQMLDDYHHLQSTRFPDSIFLNIQLKNIMPTDKIPYFSLVTLVENAIKHTVFSHNKPLNIDIWREDDYIFVKNNINKKKIAETSTGIGLKNLIERYKFLYNSDLQVVDSNDYFLIKLKIIH